MSERTRSETAPPSTRLFEAADGAHLRAIYRLARAQAFHWLVAGTLRLDDFDHDTDGEAIWVAVHEHKPVGFVSAWTAENFVHNLFVHPAMTGQGIGSALLTECLRNIGRPAALKCDARNTAARDFYLRRQWAIAARGDGPRGEYLLMQLGS